MAIMFVAFRRVFCARMAMSAFAAVIMSVLMVPVNVSAEQSEDIFLQCVVRTTGVSSSRLDDFDSSSMMAGCLVCGNDMRFMARDRLSIVRLEAFLQKCIQPFGCSFSQGHAHSLSDHVLVCI